MYLLFIYIFCTAKQHYLAVTDDVGMVRVFEIPKAFYFPSRNEVRAPPFAISCLPSLYLIVGCVFT